MAVRAVRALSEGLIIDLGIGRKLDVLAGYVEGSTRKCIAFHHEGDWALAVLNVS